MPRRNVFTVLEKTAAEQGDKAALHQPTGGKNAKEYRSYTWNEWLRGSREIALGLRQIGLKNGDIVTILCETRAEFYIVDVGIMGAGGVSAALYTSYPMPDLAKNLHALHPDFLLVEDSNSLSALRKAVHDLGHSMPTRIVVITGEADGDAITLEQLKEKGRRALDENQNAFADLQESIHPEDPAILYLTSGATGEPKMGVTSHAAILTNIDMCPFVLPIHPEDSTIAFLPSAHIAQRVVLEFAPMLMGTPVWFSESLARLPSELKTIRPTLLLAPPRVWERMYATINAEIKKRPPRAQKLFAAALRLGGRAVDLKQASARVPLWMKATLAVADKVIFSKVRERLGGRIRIAISGAAPLGRELAHFFASLGLPLIEGYGITEAGILCFNPVDKPRPGSIGKMLPGIQGRLADDGELQVKSPCLFSGYYQDEAATKSVVVDGWFSTGDVAAKDDDDFWYITGRKKELIVSSNGKKIYPARIENLFKLEPFISQVLLLGDKQPYVTALLTVNVAQAQALDGMQEFETKPAAEVVRAKPVTTAIESAIARVNSQLADFERIRRFRVVDRDFSIEYGEMTPTMKLRRNKVIENHRHLINELYLGRDESR